MRLLFVENDDSFSWNVVDRLPFERDEITMVSGRDQSRVRDALQQADALVIGPGPLDPERAGLIDIVRWAADRRLPTLGICLGHQAIGLAFGAHLIRERPTHGERSCVSFRPSQFFSSFMGPVEVMPVMPIPGG